MSVPEAVVNGGMKAFEDMYNANNTTGCGNCYAPDCKVTVNGDVVGTTPEAVGAFLDGLRNKMGGTNIHFTVTEIKGVNHKDTWVADNGTGACDATWAQKEDGSWHIVEDHITFTPKPSTA